MDKNKFQIHVDKKTLKNPSKTKELAVLQKSNPNIEFDLEPSSSSSSSSSSMSMASQMEENEVIEPKDPATIKYLSNVVDQNTGDISKPFTIADKKYQMVRGQIPSGEVVMGVYCFDDMDDNGVNVIHPMEYFEENIAKPMKEAMGMQGSDSQVSEEEFNYAAAEKEYFDKQDFMDYLNLTDLGNARLFFINDETGEVIASFKNIIDMATSGKKLAPNERLVNRKQLKAIRFGAKLKENIALSEETVDGVNVETLKGDVKVLINKMVKMFGNYFAKLNTDVEKSVFLQNVAKIVGVPENKLSSLLSTYKDLAKDETPVSPIAENKKSKRVLKVKDIK
jgi:hypothetical protein